MSGEGFLFNFGKPPLLIITPPVETDVFKLILASAEESPIAINFLRPAFGLTPTLGMIHLHIYRYPLSILHRHFATIALIYLHHHGLQTRTRPSIAPGERK